jgi:SAM-dependent methyltransferase
MINVEFSYRLRKIAKLAKGKILDIGYSLLPNPFLKGDITGVDIVLPKHKPQNYLKLIKADVTKKLPFKDNSIDTVIMGGVIEHLENPMAALREINRVLKKNGLLLMETPNPYFLPIIFSDLFMRLKHYFYDTHINLFPRRIMLKMLWHTGFDLNKIIGCGFNINNYVTIPLPQQLSQDIIYVAVKRPVKNKHYKAVRELRENNYEKI